MREFLYRQFLQYFRNPMYLSVYILQVIFYPIALDGHNVFRRPALQERVDVVERSLNAATHKLEPLNCDRAEPKHEIMAGVQTARNGVNYFMPGVMCVIELNCQFRQRHLRHVDDLRLVQNRFGGHSRGMVPDHWGQLAAVVACPYGCSFGCGIPYGFHCAPSGHFGAMRSVGLIFRFGLMFHSALTCQARHRSASHHFCFAMASARLAKIEKLFLRVI
jgi:hypothetical protein